MTKNNTEVDMTKNNMEVGMTRNNMKVHMNKNHMEVDMTKNNVEVGYVFKTLYSVFQMFCSCTCMLAMASLQGGVHFGGLVLHLKSMQLKISTFLNCRNVL